MRLKYFLYCQPSPSFLHFFTNSIEKLNDILYIYNVIMSCIELVSELLLALLRTLQQDSDSKYMFIILLQTISISLLVLFTYLEPLMKNVYFQNFSSTVSKQTYSIYLIHIILIYLLEKINFSWLVTNLIYISLLFLLSSLIFKFIEKPLLAMRPKMEQF